MSTVRVLFLLAFVFVLASCDENNNVLIEENNARFQSAPNESAPLVRILNLESPEPTKVRLDIAQGGDSWVIEFDQLSTVHSLQVLGLRPGKTHTVLVTAFDEQGKRVSERVIEILTDPLPDDFPEFSTSGKPELMEPGVTLFEAGGFLIFVDKYGEVVWYYRIPTPGTLDRDVRRMANGNLLLLSAPFKIMEIDMLGNTVRKWHAAKATEGEEGSIPVDVNAFHHEVFEMESGNFLVLSLEVREFEDYPSSAEDPEAPSEDAKVVGDVIVEFTPEGELVNEWFLLDILDPFRINYSSLLGIWDVFFSDNFGIDPPTRDWSHGNGVIHDTRDDSIIISLRHQDAVVKISRQTGGLHWILGPHENWDLDEFGAFLLNPVVDDEFFFQYHQHAPMITDDGNIILFDNGNNRASPFDPIIEENIFSRAVEYSIDESSLEVDLVWESTGFSNELIFAGFLGDADSLSQTGNVLITFGGRQPAVITEITKDSPAMEVFRIDITSAFTYRAERLPSLYP